MVIRQGVKQPGALTVDLKVTFGRPGQLAVSDFPPEGSNDMPTIQRIDHLVLTVCSIEATCSFYEHVLGFQRHDVESQPVALLFGDCKINVHAANHTFEPKADDPRPGAGDFCLVTTDDIDDWVVRVIQSGVAVEVGPVEREGASGPMTSIYFRDPDRNLFEVSRYNRL
jgi:catechol 2,3-dioxygenase-like lactoylglutathione lyase family enzyme